MTEADLCGLRSTCGLPVVVQPEWAARLRAEGVPSELDRADGDPDAATAALAAFVRELRDRGAVFGHDEVRRDRCASLMLVTAGRGDCHVVWANP